LVFGVPESWAGITSPPWPALSDTIGHLEQLWHPVRVIVVTLIVFAAFHAVRYPPVRTGEFAAPQSKPTRCRTPCDRFARSGTGVPVVVYFPVAIGVVAGSSILAAIVKQRRAPGACHGVLSGHLPRRQSQASRSVKG